MQKLFNGTLHFVQMAFNVAPENKTYSVSNQDMNTIIQYAGAAAVPISLYADQYGDNQVVVNSTVIPYPVTLSSHSCTASQMEGWIEDLTKKTPGPACFVVMFPDGIDNTKYSRAGGFGGFHDSVNGTPYINAYISSVPNVPALTVADSQYQYAGRLSHEMAEMTVNPVGGNPEVCDPCGPNYNSTYLSYFDSSGSYLGTTQTPPYQVNFTYGFYINGIVEPAYAQPASAPAAACEYAPVKISEAVLSTSTAGTRCDGFYSADDQYRHAVILGAAGEISEIAFSPAKGQTATNLAQIGQVSDIAAFYTPDDKAHHVLAISANGNVSEVVFGPLKGQSTIVNIPGAQHVSGFYSDDDSYRHAIVADANGAIWEYYFHPTKGHGLTKLLQKNGIVDLGSFYTPDDHYRHVIVATADGEITEIYYQPKFNVSATRIATVTGVKSVSGFYVPGSLASRRVHALTQQGDLYETRYSSSYTATSFRLTVIPQGLDLGGFYTADDKARHSIVLSAGSRLVEEYYYT